MTLLRWTIAVVVAASPYALRAQASPPPAGACAAPEFRQFDFWLGAWTVTTPDGRRAGTNTIRLILNDCVLHEQWEGADGSRGQSFNIYDAASRRWRQSWVADRGTALWLEGGLRDGRMVLTGRRPARGDSTVTLVDRITWSPLPGGDVRQLWETSRDGGATWTVAFDGRYARQR
jgi:hypothetical protein